MSQKAFEFSVLVDRRRLRVKDALLSSGASIGHRSLETGYDGRRSVTLIDGQRDGTSAQIRRAPDRPEMLAAMHFHGLWVALQSLGHPTTSLGGRPGALRDFLEQADSFEVEQEPGQPATVVLRREGQAGRTTTSNGFRLDPILHCVRSIGDSAGHNMTLEIDYDWRDDFWLPIRTVRTAGVKPTDGDGRFSVMSRVETEFMRIERIDSVPDEDFIPKIQTHVAVYDEFQESESKPLDPEDRVVRPEPGLWDRPNQNNRFWLTAGILAAACGVGWWYVRRQG